MAVNIIVVAVTLLMAAIVAIWVVCPGCRAWIEAPRWQPLKWEQQPDVSERGEYANDEHKI